MSHGAEVIVQEAWLLRIVRNTAYAFLQKGRSGAPAEELDRTVHVSGGEPSGGEELLVRSAERRKLQEALEAASAISRGPDPEGTGGIVISSVVVGKRGGMEFCAVSDVGREDIEQLVQLLKC